MKSLKGQFVVASPHLTGGNFFRTAVLVLNHDHDGALGVVLNRPIANPMQEIWEDLGVEAVAGQAIFLGGPVPGPILALHPCSDVDSGEILDGVFLASQKEQIQEVLSRSAVTVRVIVGYSGWGAGQLEREFTRGSWLATSAVADDVFRDRDDLWEYLVQSVGQRILAPHLGHRPRPDDPRWN
ncbi:MAG: YqgE/AlgH family protein [Planctomycetes bacterium]|nr:YqgE/AlgH family protein [Planctomycetota bacterium]